MTATTPRLCVIIPTVNEIASLPSLLDQLRLQQGIAFETIVADGGSGDGTPQAADRPGVRLVQTSPGRGRQMNAAAAQTDAGHLLFLHADSALTSNRQLADAVQALEAAGSRLGHQRVAGHFRLRFRRDRPGRDLAYRYYQEKSALNLPECTNGDQGFLLSRAFFQELGGFDESLRFLEDQRLAETIRQVGTWITLPGRLITSARRFEQEGLGRRMILSALIMNFHRIGFLQFLQRAPAVYRDQDRTGLLPMAPLLRLVHDLNREAGGEIARHRWLATGRYVLSHAWQPFFFLDVTLGHLFGGERRPFLWFYRRIFHPATSFRLFDYLTAGLTWVWFHLTWLYFAIHDRNKRGGD